MQNIIFVGVGYLFLRCLPYVYPNLKIKFLLVDNKSVTIKTCDLGETRTLDPLIKSQLLYQLSYEVILQLSCKYKIGLQKYIFPAILKALSMLKMPSAPSRFPKRVHQYQMWKCEQK